MVHPLVLVSPSARSESVIAPPEPVALRLSAQLMYGVIRVYSQKSEQLLADVTAMHTTVRKSLSAISVAIVVGGGDVDMPSVSHRHAEALTLPENAAPYAGDFDQPFAWDWELNLDSHGEGVSMSGISSGARLPASPSPTPARDRFTAAKEKITLPSHRTDQGLFADMEEGRGEQVGESLDINMMDFAGDDGLALDLGLGEGFDIPTIDESAMHHIPAGDPSSSVNGAEPVWGDAQADDQGLLDDLQ
jgi:meiotic recombination protein REC8